MPTASKPGTDARILLLDDDDAVREALTDLLQELGATVAPAASVGEARPLLDTFAPTAVMTDVYMPGENGMVMLAEVRERFPGIPVVALTGADDAQVSADAGFSRIVRKPVSMHELADVLTALRPA